jgi:hypothetical protein
MQIFVLIFYWLNFLSFGKTYIFSWLNLYVIGKTSNFWQNFYLLELFLKTIFSANFFNKTFWLPYWHSYFIDLTCFLFVYLPTCLAINLPIYLFNYLPTHPLTYLSTYYLLTHPPTHLPTYHLHDVNVCQCMIYKIWKYCTKWTNNHFNHVWPFDINKW